MSVRHLGTFSLLGGRSQRGYTEEQGQALGRSARIKRRREERETRLKREELVSEERRARMKGEADIGYARVTATGRLAERGMAERGMTERTRMTTARELGKQRLVGEQEKAAPKYREEERELALGKYATTVGSLATEFTRFITDEETGETRPVVSTVARKIAQKYQNLYLTDPERAVESVKSELAAKKVGMDRNKRELDRWSAETGAIPPAELDIMEGYGDEAEALITKWSRKMRAQEAEVRREEEEAVAEPGVPKVRAGTWGESLLGRTFRSIRERRREVAGRRRIGGPVGLEY